MAVVKKKPTTKTKTAPPKAKTVPAKSKTITAGAKASPKPAVKTAVKTEAPAKAAPPVIQRPQPAAQTPPRVLAAMDKMDITDLVHHLARAMDRMDETLLRSVFHADATLDLGPGVFQGAAAEYVPWILSVLGQARSTHHLIGQVMVQLQGDTAFVETYAQAHFRSDKPTGREDLFMGLRYLDRMEKRPAGTNGVFKIIHRKQVIDWVRTEAVSDLFYHQNPDALWSYRNKTDPSYQMAQFPGAGGRAASVTGRRYDAKSFRF